MSVPEQPSAKVDVEPVNSRSSIESVAVSFSHSTSPSILATSLQNGRYGRFSIFASHPLDVFSVRRLGPMCPLDALAKRVSSYPSTSEAGPGLPFAGGWIGFVAYEGGLVTESIEPTTDRDVPLPVLRFCLYDAAAVYDHQTREWYLTAVDWPQPLAGRRPSVSTRLAALRNRLASAPTLDPTDPPPRPATSPPAPNMSHEEYLAKVDRAKRYIAAGDIYQVNLTQRFTVRTDASPAAIWQRLCRSSPSPYSALLLWDDTAILSSSPELFLELRDRHVVTRPIKGTRPRVGDPRIDKANRRELAESEKDRAELTMIIDLLRNDLGRVCSFGTVNVTCAGEIEEHPTVFHRVATIEGDLAHQHGWVDLLRAAFPGGSVTGAPKIRAIQIIDELEPTTRGVYCGSIGLIGLDGSMSLNIAIRTMVHLDGAVHMYAGGAIVADSTPEDEYDEIIAKATGMFRALGCQAPSESRLPAEVTVS
jgi:aminodeoxychorismate synthase component I